MPVRFIYLAFIERLKKNYTNTKIDTHPYRQQTLEQNQCKYKDSTDRDARFQVFEHFKQRNLQVAVFRIKVTVQSSIVMVMKSRSECMH